ncbi:sugar transferase [Exiguobacterium sp. AM39-5BH]|uniref:sugar transferase n=1 Tax=Exiguobacterium sp. AM39-5BH TaxID=2292355 RepID=UPI000FE2721D|nr:sugar transferase [Exiguobacterium sp. AM39-5BH]RHB49235.1 sugar transferase [Exiguobacterium sp. AM39-5BH]
MYKNKVKRVLDFGLSLTGIIVLSPLFLIVALLVRVKLGSPIIFKQKRPGLNEEIFTMYKFRTMTNQSGMDGDLLPDAIRLTKFGRWLRSTSLDELPEMFNILWGDMSIVGPRPLAVQYLPYYTDEERVRHSVRPGLTGLAQINGRNNTTWEKRFEYDLSYISNISFLSDLKIILKTFQKILQRADIGERGVDAPPDLDQYRINNQ